MAYPTPGPGLLSARAIKRILLFLLLASLGGVFSHMVRLPQDVVAGPPPPPPLTFGGGCGDTPATAIIIQNAPDYVAVVGGEYQYLRQHFGQKDRDWQVAEKEVYQHGSQVYDLFLIQLPHGNEQYIFFDITKYFKKP